MGRLILVALWPSLYQIGNHRSWPDKHCGLKSGEVNCFVSTWFPTCQAYPCGISQNWAGYPRVISARTEYELLRRRQQRPINITITSTISITSTTTTAGTPKVLTILALPNFDSGTYLSYDRTGLDALHCTPGSAQTCRASLHCLPLKKDQMWPPN